MKRPNLRRQGSFIVVSVGGTGYATSERGTLAYTETLGLTPGAFAETTGQE